MFDSTATATQQITPIVPASPSSPSTRLITLEQATSQKMVKTRTEQAQLDLRVEDVNRVDRAAPQHERQAGQDLAQELGPRTQADAVVPQADGDRTARRKPRAASRTGHRRRAIPNAGPNGRSKS